MALIDFWQTRDLRFPTSLEFDGSDAMNPDPDYSAAYLSFGCAGFPNLFGHASVFTIGRGNDVQVAAIESLKPFVLGRDLDDLLADMGLLYKELTGDSQLRWLGPEKGVMHMAIGAVVNALWDIKSKQEGKPLWEVLADMSPGELCALVDFRYLEGSLTPAQALEIFEGAVPDRGVRKKLLRAEGYPAYTTTPGWLGYSDEKLSRLCREAIAGGFSRIKIKVGANRDDDIRRLAIARDTCGAGFPIAVDANQRWEVSQAIDWITALAPFGLDWVEEPTSPDDVQGHLAISQGVSPVRVSTGEHMANRIVARQLLEVHAVNLLQIDSSRVAGVNENIAILLLAARAQVPVFPHAGGVGLCEAVQHLAFFDYVAISGLKEDRAIEFVDHLHQHFVDPIRLERGRYWPTEVPGNSQEITPRTFDSFCFPRGTVWQELSRGVAPH